ncbi:MAG: GNAT family N-acetyltransferase, partial [Candidatus Eremiobacteraeota bacterium]|nr:GNAT family N-acetyltransferase [Candidatus Eremiobacteraeota bacterium]
MSGGTVARVTLRDATEADVPIFFAHQLDPTANVMAAFTARDPSDANAFRSHWARMLADNRIVKKTIVEGSEVVGHLLSFEQSGRRSVGYWIAREHWGRGIATEALGLLLREVETRPLYARAATDNVASVRVLEKCGFRAIGAERSYSYARGTDVDEVLLV